MDGPDTHVDGASASIVGAADSSYKSRVPLHATWVNVTANTNDTNDWIVLPTGVKSGHEIRGWSAVAHEIRTEAASDLKINNVDSDGTQEAAVPSGGRLWTATYINATVGWILTIETHLGARVSAIVPD